MTHDQAVEAICEQLAAEHSADAELLEAARRLARSLLPLAEQHDLDSVVLAAVAHASGLGPLHQYMVDPLVNEIMVNNGGDVWIEREGRTSLAGHLPSDVTPRIIERMLNPVGRRLDRLSPIVDARLPDGSRVCAVIAPIAIDGACFTMRRFGVRRRVLHDFAHGAVIDLLHALVDHRCNVLISGATSSGKTSLLNALASRITAGERVITLEDTAELQLGTSHVLRLEARAATADGASAITMTDLVRTSLRLRPDRLVLGEIRGAEVIDMLQALNTGHDGSMSTCHANSALDALRRIEALVVQHAPGWPIAAVREQVCSSLDVVIHLERDASGLRRVRDIIELAPPTSVTTPAAHRTLVADGVVVNDLHRVRGRRRC